MLALLSNFIVSMLASLSHADIDSTYSLFAFYALLTHRQYNSIREVLIILIVITALVIVSDFWVLGLMQFERTSGGNKFFGCVWTVVEIGLKIGLEVMLVSWKKHISDADSKRPVEQKETFNSELGYWYVFANYSKCINPKTTIQINKQILIMKK